jgi:hypothetical protein
MTVRCFVSIPESTGPCACTTAVASCSKVASLPGVALPSLSWLNLQKASKPHARSPPLAPPWRRCRPRRFLFLTVHLGHAQVRGPELPLPKLLPDTVVRGRARLPSYAAARITDTDHLEPAGAEVMGSDRAFTPLRRCQSRPACTLDQEPHGCSDTIDK